YLATIARDFPKLDAEDVQWALRDVLGFSAQRNEALEEYRLLALAEEIRAPRCWRARDPVAYMRVAISHQAERYCNDSERRERDEQRMKRKLAELQSRDSRQRRSGRPGWTPLRRADEAGDVLIDERQLIRRLVDDPPRDLVGLALLP